ncbi:IclR family transcriptional regulator domain-containing protein [Halocatena marina]|uniref:IclR-ED domain-containing protein n=1 Tax=Halocatena marina TaxID=2934937 RepID=A0ABD5YX15_9EURY
MSTAHRHVKTLEEQDFVVSNGQQIQLSTEFLRFGNGVRYRTDLADVSEPHIEELAIETEERANLFIEELGDSVCIHRKLENCGVIADTEIGKRFPMHATVAGRRSATVTSPSMTRNTSKTSGQ